MTMKTDRPSAAVRMRVMKRDRFQCTYCGKPGTDVELEVDHIIPISKGGSNHMSNLTTACRRCNQEKVSVTTWDSPVNTSMKTNNSSYVGLFFITFKVDGALDKQGVVERDFGDGNLLVSYFGWFDGEQLSESSIIKSNSISHWYSSEYTFNKAGAYYIAKFADRIYPGIQRLIDNLKDNYNNFDRYYNQRNG